MVPTYPGLVNPVAPMEPWAAYTTETPCTWLAMQRGRQLRHLVPGATSYLIIHFWLLKVAVPLLLFLSLSVPLPISFSFPLSVTISVSLPITLPFPVSLPLLVPRYLGCGGHIIPNVFKYTRKQRSLVATVTAHFHVPCPLH